MVGEPVPRGDVMVNIVFPRDRQERWVPPNTHTGKIIAYEKKAHLQKAELKLKKKQQKNMLFL